MSRFVLPEGVSLREFSYDSDMRACNFAMPAKEAKMVTIFRSSTRFYTIDELEVGHDNRRQGVGK